MRSSKEGNNRKNKKVSSPKRTRPVNQSGRNSRLSPPPSVSVLDSEIVTEELALFENLEISPKTTNPRSFPYSVKQQCWDKAEKVKGRDPDRWRRDPLGNTIFRKLVGCPGCLCHDYDHIVPYSKGGESTLENCQVLQATVNRSKGNRTDISKAELIQRSSYCRVSAQRIPDENNLIAKAVPTKKGLNTAWHKIYILIYWKLIL
ncbi:uncharacterized protein LOC132044245 isoform X3 [Lycium ferocissimum]|uniref:uncharacterized protein LOC132044245 isoform X3 n=1 Tax=Lycium ferocissimum TaxID=112874 RepID=UPI002815EF06|nr:uncharacterized protein LOC132044245 isoform X3 [Lycium ferocissimum]